MSTPRRPPPTAIGRRAEERARAHLEELGYRILATNWRGRGRGGGEIDLVARDGEVLAIVEVRSRARTDFGHPLETVDARKRARLRRAAAEYLAAHGAAARGVSPHGRSGGIRFDVVAVVGDEVDLRKGAFE